MLKVQIEIVNKILAQGYLQNQDRLVILKIVIVVLNLQIKRKYRWKKTRKK